MHRYIQSDEAADSDNKALSCKPPEEVGEHIFYMDQGSLRSKSSHNPLPLDGIVVLMNR